MKQRHSKEYKELEQYIWGGIISKCISNVNPPDGTCPSIVYKKEAISVKTND